MTGDLTCFFMRVLMIYMEKINWGFIGTGHIAEKMAKAIASLEKACLFACAAQTGNAAERSAAFAAKYGFAKSYSNYDSLLNDENVNIVYIATTNINHAELSIKAMKAGKAVLCEKPAAINAAELKQVIEVSEKTGMLYIEALWSRYLPAWQTAMQWISLGKIGKILNIYADFCFKAPYSPESRVYDKTLGGGALLDVGIYPLALALSAIGSIRSSIKITSADCNVRLAESLSESPSVTGFVDSSGGNIPRSLEQNKGDATDCNTSGEQQTSALATKFVDSSDSMILSFDAGEIAVLSSAIDLECGRHFKSARIAGTEGTVYMPEFWKAEEVHLLAPDGKIVETKKLPFNANGYEYEAQDAMNCYEKKLIQSAVHKHSDSLALAELMDIMFKSAAKKNPAFVPPASAFLQPAPAAASSPASAPVTEAACVNAASPNAPVTEAAPVSATPVTEASSVSAAPAAEPSAAAASPVSAAPSVNAASAMPAAAAVTEAACVNAASPNAPVTDAAPVSATPVTEASSVSAAPAAEPSAAAPVNAAASAAAAPVSDEIVVYTDGACSGNPGRGGWGAVVLADGAENQLSGGEKLTTNNRMELMAAIEALEFIIENRSWRGRRVTVVSDSQYVKNGIQQWILAWKKNGWRTSNKEPVKNKDLWLELDEAVQLLKPDWRWVKGHAGNKYNEICDQLAVAAAKKM